jgi:thioredoxin 1
VESGYIELTADLAEFGRGTCIPCKEMKPILEEVARDYVGRLNVMIISVDDYAALTREFRISAIPTQVFLDKDGQEVGRHIGFLPKKDIVASLARMGLK